MNAHRWILPMTAGWPLLALSLGSRPASRLPSPLVLVFSLMVALMAQTAWAGEPAAHHARPAGIAWFDGDIDAALAAAGTQKKPVFLYWGAVWCPPCQELKATIFKRRDFLDRLNLFVPVFLDGDAPGAQAVGERFHVSGYPTVLVLRADGTELERVSGGMDLSRYAEVLDLALGEVQSARQLLATLSGDGAKPVLTPAGCRQLAYNAWELDEAWSKPETLLPLAGQLLRAAQACPASLRTEHARLQILALAAALDAQSQIAKSGQTTTPVAAATLAPVPAILADHKLALAVGDALQSLGDAYFKAAVAADPSQRAVLRTRWFAVMDGLARDPRYSAADQTDALRSKLIAAKALDDHGTVPPDLAKAVTARIDAALAREKDPYSRASLVNSALNVLDVLGDDDRAGAILAGEVKTAAQPYYYMADLGELEEKRGHPDLALDWLARSYHTAEGPATRFQWGVGYVRGLVRIHPQDEAAIRAAALDVLGDLDAAGDLHGRTRRSLARLETSLRGWNAAAAHAGVVAAVRDRMQAICGRLPATDPSRDSCNSFLAQG